MGKRQRRTHRGEEAAAADAADAAGETDALRGLWGQTAQRLLLFHGFCDRPHNDALVVLEVVLVYAVLSRLVQNCSQLIALVATLG